MLSSKCGKKDALLGMLIMFTKIYILPSVRKTFILVEEKLFQTYVMDALGFLNDCYEGKFWKIVTSV